MYPSPGEVIFTPIILPVFLISPYISSGSKWFIKLPSITSPAAPTPFPPPKNSIFGEPHANGLLVLQFPIPWLPESLTLEPKIPHSPTFSSKELRPLLTPPKSPSFFACKDAGSQRPKGRASERQQQPTQKRGSASLSPREQQKKARAERLAGKSGGKSKEQLKKAADKLLAKKKKSVHPDYKPQKASGYTAHERRKIRRAGQRLVKDIQKGKEKPISNYNPGV